MLYYVMFNCLFLFNDSTATSRRVDFVIFSRMWTLNTVAACTLQGLARRVQKPVACRKKDWTNEKYKRQEGKRFCWDKQQRAWGSWLIAAYSCCSCSRALTSSMSSVVAQKSLSVCPVGWMRDWMAGCHSLFTCLFVLEAHNTYCTQFSPIHDYSSSSCWPLSTALIFLISIYFQLSVLWHKRNYYH